MAVIKHKIGHVAKGVEGSHLFRGMLPETGVDTCQ